MEIAFGIWLCCHEFAAIIVLLALAPDRDCRRQMREHFSEYKFFSLAPFVLGRSVIQAVPAWLLYDVLPRVHSAYALLARDYKRSQSNYLSGK